MLCAALLPLSALAVGAQAVVSEVSRDLEVVGTDQASVARAHALGTHVLQRCRQWLQQKGDGPPRALFVTLRPVDRADFEGEYRVRVGTRGVVTLDFRWTASLSLETACHAFAEAAIIRYAYFNYGPSAPAQVRFWPVAALGAHSYVSLRSAEKLNYIESARRHGVGALQPLLEQNLNAAAAAAASPRSGYWLWMSLREAGLGQAVVADLLRRAIAGWNIEPKLESILRAASVDSAPIDLEAWWQTQTEQWLSRSYDACESLDVSRDWIAEMADFERYRSEGGELANLRSLWRHRSNAELRAVLSARREMIRVRLQRVNPAYFNAAHALAALYTTTLDATRAHQFTAALAIYLSDWQDTLQMHQFIRRSFEAGE